VLLQLTPATELEAAAYAARQGAAAYLQDACPALSPEQAGRAVISLVASPGTVGGRGAYLLTADGLAPAP
jgi:hypothetical protein